jgi:hypothetical protein
MDSWFIATSLSQLESRMVGDQYVGRLVCTPGVKSHWQPLTPNKREVQCFGVDRNNATHRGNIIHQHK